MCVSRHCEGCYRKCKGRLATWLLIHFRRMSILGCLPTVHDGVCHLRYSPLHEMIGESIKGGFQAYVAGTCLSHTRLPMHSNEFVLLRPPITFGSAPIH